VDRFVELRPGSAAATAAITLANAAPTTVPATLKREPRAAAVVREGNVAAVGSKTERQAARALVAAYHEARLADLIGGSVSRW
jgi:hypothetical protein